MMLKSKERFLGKLVVESNIAYKMMLDNQISYSDYEYELNMLFFLGLDKKISYKELKKKLEWIPSEFIPKNGVSENWISGPCEWKWPIMSMTEIHYL